MQHVGNVEGSSAAGGIGEPGTHSPVLPGGVVDTGAAPVPASPS